VEPDDHGKQQGEENEFEHDSKIDTVPTEDIAMPDAVPVAT